MKKHIIAAAVAAAVAVPAMAQNVTVYGRLDASYTNFKSENGAAAGTVESSGIRYNSYTTSRLGVTGGEDLGGGMKASFGLEGRIGVNTSRTASTAIQNAAGGAYTTATNGTDAAFGGFNRQAWLELSGGFGAIRLGLTDLETKVLFDTFNAGGAANTIGQAGDVLTNSLFASRGTGVKFTSNDMSGLKFVLSGFNQRSFDTVNALNASLKNTTGSGYEAALKYASGPLAATAVLYNVESARTAGAEGEENKQKQTSLGASYNLGFATLTYVYGNTKVDVTGGATQTKSNVSEVGARVPLSSATTLWVSAATGEATNDNTQAYQLGFKYDLSKRTYAYGIYGKTDVDNTSVAQKQTSLGIVHQF